MVLREDYYVGRGRRYSDYGVTWLRKVFGMVTPSKGPNNAFNEIAVLNPQPDSEGIISVSLWGDGVSKRFWKELMEPLLHNVNRLNSILPGWVCRVYASNDLPEKVIWEIIDAGCEVYVMPAPRQGGEGFAWRFLATAESKPVVIHDADMDFDELQPGLFDVIEQWLATDRPFLRRRLHAVNVWGNPVSGGLWGSRPRLTGESPLVNVRENLSKYSFEGYGIDEAFLTKEVWPVMKREGYYTTKLSREGFVSSSIIVLFIILSVALLGALITGGVLLRKKRKRLSPVH